MTLKDPLVPAVVVLAPLGPVSVVVKVPALLSTARFMLAETKSLMVIVELCAVPVAASVYCVLFANGARVAIARRVSIKAELMPAIRTLRLLLI